MTKEGDDHQRGAAIKKAVQPIFISPWIPVSFPSPKGALRQTRAPPVLTLEVPTGPQNPSRRLGGASRREGTGRSLPSPAEVPRAPAGASTAPLRDHPPGHKIIVSTPWKCS